MNKTFFIVSLALMAMPLCAEIYKWTDNSGDVHFGDKPRPGAEKITLPPIQTYSPPATPAIETKTNADNKTKTNDVSDYSIFAILQPSNQATIWDNSGNMPVLLQVEPTLKPGDMLQLLVDDTPMGNPQNNLIFNLTGINRGSHTLVAKIINSNGDEVAATDRLTFFIHRAMKHGRVK